jgi:nucleotide-binding universal stress UspA family protein
MRVLVAIDQTHFWKQVIDSVCARDFPANTEFKILTVLEFSPFHWDEQNSVEWKKVAQELMHHRRDEAHKIMVEARETLARATGNCTVHTELRQGSAREEIINSAIDWMPQKIFLGAHGHAPNRLLPGAVSSSVARRATCSVELIRLKEDAKTSQALAAPRR